MSAALLAALKSRFPQAADRASADHPAVNVLLADVVPALRFLRDERAFDLLMDVTAIDWAAGASPRFTVVYHLLSTTRPGSYIRVAAPCAGSEEAPTAPSHPLSYTQRQLVLEKQCHHSGCPRMDPIRLSIFVPQDILLFL